MNKQFPRLYIFICITAIMVVFLISAKPINAQNYIVVGLSNYQYFPSEYCPEFADNDAFAIGNYLLNVTNVSENKIKLLVEEKALMARLRIECEKTILQETPAGETVVFYFGGNIVADIQTQEIYFAGLHLVPGGDCSLNDSYGFKELNELAQKAANKGIKVVLLLDAFRLSGNFGFDNDNIIASLVDKYKSLSIISACSSQQASNEAEFWKDGHSLFSVMLVDGLNGKADANGDKSVTDNDLFNFLKAEILKESDGLQTPFSGNLQNVVIAKSLSKNIDWADLNEKIGNLLINREHLQTSITDSEQAIRVSNFFEAVDNELVMRPKYSAVSKSIKIIQYPQLNSNESPARFVVFDKLGKMFASFGADEIIRIWNVYNREINFSLNYHKAKVIAADFSPDGNLLASASEDMDVFVWNKLTEKEKKLKPSEKFIARTLKFSANGKWLAVGGDDKNVTLWNTSTWEESTVFEGHTARIENLDISSDNKYLIASAINKKLILWDIETGEILIESDIHKENIVAVKFSKEENLAFSLSQDGFFVVWDLKTLTPQKTFALNIDKIVDFAVCDEYAIIANNNKISTLLFKSDTLMPPFDFGLSTRISSFGVNSAYSKICVAFGGRMYLHDLQLPTISGYGTELYEKIAAAGTAPLQAMKTEMSAILLAESQKVVGAYLSDVSNLPSIRKLKDAVLCAELCMKYSAGTNIAPLAEKTYYLLHSLDVLHSKLATEYNTEISNLEKLRMRYNGISAVPQIISEFYLAQNKADTAFMFAENAALISSNALPALFVKSKAEILAGNINAAYQTLQTAQNNCVISLQAKINLAESYIFQGNFNEANNVLNAANEMDTNSLELFYMKGKLEFERNNYSKAENYWSFCLSKNPNFFQARIMLYKLYLKLYLEGFGGFPLIEQAGFQLNAALKLSMNNPEILSELSMFYSFLVKYNKPESDIYLAQIFNLNVHNRGDIIERVGLEATNIANKALEISPDLLLAKKAFANAYLVADNKQKAVKILKAEVDSLPALDVEYHELGIIAQQTGDITLALSSFKSAIALNKFYLEAYQKLWTLYVQLEMFDQLDSLYMETEIYFGNSPIFDYRYAFEKEGINIKALSDAVFADPLYHLSKCALENYKFLQKNEGGYEKFDAEYDFERLYFVDSTHLIVKQHGKFGLVDIAGKMNIPAEFDSIIINEFMVCCLKYNRAAYTSQVGKVEMHYIDFAGNTLDYAEYQSAAFFGDGYIKVKMNNLYGIINNTGVVIIPTNYQEVEYYGDKIARLAQEGKYVGFTNFDDGLKQDEFGNFHPVTIPIINVRGRELQNGKVVWE